MHRHIAAKRQAFPRRADPFPIVASTTLGSDAKARTCADSAIAASTSTSGGLLTAPTRSKRLPHSTGLIHPS